MGVCDHRHAGWAHLLERSRRRGARGDRRRGLQRVLRLPDGHRPRIQPGGSPSDVERRDVARHRRVRGSAGRGDLPRGPGRLADSCFRLAGRHGRDLLCRTPHSLGLSRPGGARHRVVVRAVDGAGKRVSLHRRAVRRRIARVLGAGVSHHVARGGERDPRLPSGHAGGQAQSRGQGGAPASSRPLCRSRDGGIGGRSRSASSPGCFPSACLAALLAAPLLVSSASQAGRSYESPRLFVPAIRSIVRCYLVAMVLFMAGILLPAWWFG